MHVVIGILASQGVLAMVQWFGEVPTVARYVIIAMSAAIVSGAMWMWREGRRNK